jgi:hypothetical protein
VCAVISAVDSNVRSHYSPNAPDMPLPVQGDRWHANVMEIEKAAARMTLERALARAPLARRRRALQLLSRAPAPRTTGCHTVPTGSPCWSALDVRYSESTCPSSPSYTVSPAPINRWNPA